MFRPTGNNNPFSESRRNAPRSICGNIISIQKFLQPLVTLQFNEEAAAVYGKIRAELERKGEPIGAMDILIATQAISEELVLITNNVREFQKIDSIHIENWTLDS